MKNFEKKPRPIASNNILPDLLNILVPSEYLNDFEVFGVKNKPECWELELREKKSNIPKELLEKEIVLDGYCNPISIMSHCFSLKKVYLVIYRRKWKEKGQTKHFSNEYVFTPGGAKITKELAFFLKDRD